MNEVQNFLSNGKSTYYSNGYVKPRSKNLALFDFDGTITSHDTLAEFIIFFAGHLKFYFGLMVLSPALILYKLGILANQKAKEILLSFFFKRMPLNYFHSICELFVKHKLPDLIRKSALIKIHEHLAYGDRVIIVSASPENWVGEWAITQGLEFIATQLEVRNGVLTGRLKGKNCRGEEKVNRIKSYLDLTEFKTIYTYGDTKDDQPMLQLGSKMSYKPFRN